MFLCMLPIAVALSSSGGVTKSQREGPILGVSFPLYSTAFGTHTKTAEPIEMPLEMTTRVGHRYRVLDEGPDPPTGRGIFWKNVAAHCKVMAHSMVSCAKTSEPIEMPFCKKNRMGPETCITWGSDPQREGTIFGGCPGHSENPRWG